MDRQSEPKQGQANSEEHSVADETTISLASDELSLQPPMDPGLSMYGAWTTIAIVLVALVYFLRPKKKALGANTVSSVSSIRAALSRTREMLGGRLDALLGAGQPTPEFFEEVEMLLLSSDIGVETVEVLIEELQEEYEKDPEGFAPKEVLKEVLLDILHAAPGVPVGGANTEGPHVILVMGVNGSGKTTTIGKLAARFTKEGKTVLLAAGDTFRAAASEQLQVWAERAGAQIVSAQSGADPASVAFDAVSAGVARGVDVVLIDTAGRLQTAKPLMEQLTKIRRVIQKVIPEGPHETLLVLDGTMGQNGLSQARLFNEAAPLTGVVVTKLDGTAKGGMIFTLANELELTVKMIGVGEGIDDLRVFEPDAFVQALF